MKELTTLVINKVYTRLIVKRRQEINFWVLYSFLVTFILSRLTVHFLPDLFITIRGVHIHHFAYGIVILALAGVLAINGYAFKYPRPVATVYGIGLGLATDEFGMWIRFEDDYWIRQSYDATLIILALLISVVYFGEFWRKLLSRVFR